jgi:hypothetical protein
LFSAESATNPRVPGAPSFAHFAKGGIPRISLPTVAYPTLCEERKGWGTRLFVVLPAAPNTNRGLIEKSFLLRKPHTRRWLGPRSWKSGVLRVFCEGWDTTNLNASRRVSNEQVQKRGDNIEVPLLNEKFRLTLIVSTKVRFVIPTEHGEICGFLSFTHRLCEAPGTHNRARPDDAHDSHNFRS